jgi:hypothetical protein
LTHSEYLGTDCHLRFMLLISESQCFLTVIGVFRLFWLRVYIGYMSYLVVVIIFAFGYVLLWLLAAILLRGS